MGRLKPSESKCEQCGIVYSIISGTHFSLKFCHVRCHFAREKELKAKANEERRKKTELNHSLNPIKCKYCNETFAKTFHTEKYCSVLCREKLYTEKKASKEKEPSKRKYTSQQINQWIEEKRLKKSGPSLKQYNAVRG